MGVVKDRNPDKSIIVSTIDNLIKGASGQAIQNANIMFDLDETTGLPLVAMFP
jgi:N-acetyl-gamma-glutamyl-phosphate reductase